MFQHFCTNSEIVHSHVFKWCSMQCISSYATPTLLLPWPKKIVTAEKVMRLIDGPIMWYRAISSFGSTATRLAVAARREVALQIEVDVARYHLIALRINLMNISAVTIFLVRVVVSITFDLTTRCFNNSTRWLHHRQDSKPNHNLIVKFHDTDSHVRLWSSAADS